MSTYKLRDGLDSTLSLDSASFTQGNSPLPTGQQRVLATSNHRPPATSHQYDHHRDQQALAQNGTDSSPRKRHRQYSISSVLADPNPSSSLLPTFPSLSANTYMPASLSSLSTAFTSSAVPQAAPPVGSTSASGSASGQVAQRRSRAPPIVVSELRKVPPSEFDSYLRELAPEWERWQKELRLGAEGNPDLGARAPSTDGAGGGGRSPRSSSKEKQKRKEESLPPLDVVPQIFFDPGFNLANPRTFDLVTERMIYTNEPEKTPLLPDEPTFASTSSSSSPTSFHPPPLSPPALTDPSQPLPLPTVADMTLADLASDQILQEKLSHYTAVIESHLVREIGLRSSSFFSALSNLQSLHQQGEDCLEKISELQGALKADTPGVGRAAEDGLKVLRGQARRRALEKIDDGVRAVEEVWSAVEGVGELVSHGEWVAALEVAEHVEALYFGTASGSSAALGGESSPSSSKGLNGTPPSASAGSTAVTTTAGGQKLQLTRVTALASVPKRLTAFRAQIAKSLEAELVAVLEHETARAVPEYVAGVWKGGRGRVSKREGEQHQEEDVVRERAEERARPVVSALVRAEGMEGAVAAWRESVLRDVRAMVRAHLPTPDTMSVEDEDAFTAPTTTKPGDSGSLSEKSLTLAKNLRAMPHSEFLSLAEKTYVGLLGALTVVDVHANVLLSLTTALHAAEASRKAKRLGLSASSAANSSHSSLLDTTHSAASRASPPASPSPSSPNLTPFSASTLESDVSDVVHAAAELANLRFSKVIGVRTDAHAHLTLDEFVAIFDASWSFVVQCEIICQRMIVGLRGVMVGQAKTFLQTFHQQRITESAKVVENEQWSAAEAGRKTQKIVNLIVEAAVSDPTPLLLGKRLYDRSAKLRESNQDQEEKVEEVELPEYRKQLEIEGKEYFAVAAGLAAVDVLADYLKVVVNCPLLTTDAMSKIVEYMKSFNSRTCQVVLGAGAMRSAGLKNITAKHLALASQALSIMVSLIPYIRETVRRHLNPKQAVMLVEFDKLKRDYQEHQNEIHAKLVAIMSDRLQVHCKTLESVDWHHPNTARDGTPNAYMEALVKEHMTLHKVLSRFLHTQTVELIMGQVFASLDDRLTSDFSAIEITSDEAKERLLVDARYLTSKLGELKGLEIAVPGKNLEALIEAKRPPPPPPPPPVPAPAPEPPATVASPRTSMGERPFLPKSASQTSLSSLTSVFAAAAGYIPDTSTPSSPKPQPEPPAPASTPHNTTSQTSPSQEQSSNSAPVPPPAPVRRRSMAERLAEIARRKPGGEREKPKVELPSVPQEPDESPSAKVEQPPPTPTKELVAPELPTTESAPSGPVPGPAAQEATEIVDVAAPPKSESTVEEAATPAIEEPLGTPSESADAGVLETPVAAPEEAAAVPSQSITADVDLPAPHVGPPSPLDDNDDGETQLPANSSSAVTSSLQDPVPTVSTIDTVESATKEADETALTPEAEVDVLLADEAAGLDAKVTETDDLTVDASTSPTADASASVPAESTEASPAELSAALSVDGEEVTLTDAAPKTAIPSPTTNPAVVSQEEDEEDEATKLDDVLEKQVADMLDLEEDVEEESSLL